MEIHPHSPIHINNVMFDKTIDCANVTFNFFHALNCYKGKVLLSLQSISLVIKYRVILMKCQVCSSFSNLRPTPNDLLHVSSKRSTSSVYQRVTCGRRLPKSTIMGNYISSFANFLLFFRIKMTHYWKFPIGIIIYKFFSFCCTVYQIFLLPTP